MIFYNNEENTEEAYNYFNDEYIENHIPKID